MQIVLGDPISVRRIVAIISHFQCEDEFSINSERTNGGLVIKVARYICNVAERDRYPQPPPSGHLLMIGNWIFIPVTGV